MNTLLRKQLHWMVVAFLLVASVSFAQDASMTLTSGGNNILDGVYVGPYTGTVNGVSTQMICDDFADESYTPESWSATVASLSSISSNPPLKWGDSQTLYDQVAWLATQMLNTPTSEQTTIGEYSYAIWQLTYCSQGASYCVGGLDSTASGTPFANLSGTVLSGAEGLLASIPTNLSPGSFYNFTIYTPDTSKTISCGGIGCASTPPQEFLVRAPESSAMVLFLTDVLGLLGLALVFRRRLIRTVV